MTKEENMDLRYSGKLTKDEYLAISKLNSRWILKKEGFHFDFWVLLVGIGSTFILLGIVTIRQLGPFPWYLVEFIIGFLIIAFGLKVRALPSKYWDENQNILSVDGRVSNEVIEIFTPNGNLTMHWSELNGYGQYRGIIVLYKSPISALPFLERFFETPEDWLTFKKMVIERLPVTHQVKEFGTIRTESRPVYILFIISMIAMIIYLFLHEK